MLTYKLFKTQSMLLSAKNRNGQQDAILHTVQNPEHAPISNKQEWPARCQLTSYSKSMLLSETSQEGQPDADLQPVQNHEHAPVSCKQEKPARS